MCVCFKSASTVLATILSQSCGFACLACSSGTHCLVEQGTRSTKLCLFLTLTPTQQPSLVPLPTVLVHCYWYLNLFGAKGEYK